MESQTSNSPAGAPTPGASWLTTLGWAAYLACSWTWCIGMFLPVLLVRDFGIWGFVVFAVPNVLGAAGMGWVLRDATASRWLLARHARVGVWFSTITIFFQVLFLAYIGGLFVDSFPEIGGEFLILALVTTCSAAFFGGPGIGAGTYLASLALFAWYLALADWPAIREWTSWERGVSPAAATSLVWLAPVCGLGFLLCPYLDLTFHEVRSSLRPAPGRWAFTLGFAVCFVAMIAFTLAYSGEFFHHPLTGEFEPVVLVFVHLGLQASFTVGIHLRAIVRERRGGGPFSFALWIGTMSVIMLLIYLALRTRAGAATEFPILRINPDFERAYRVMMAFYGLVFPAYVWLCMIPTRDGHSGASRLKLRVWAAAVGVAAPMFWMGFIERQTWWLGPGLGVVLAARLFLPQGKEVAPVQHPATT